MNELQGRNAILTGASRGLGVHIARALGREGINLVLAARSVDALEKVREEVSSLGVRAVVVPTNLADSAQVGTLAEEAERRLGPVDILVNNAGVESMAAYEDFPIEEIIAAVRVNLLAAMLLTRAVLPGMLQRGRGHVVNMSSLAGKTGLPFQTPYGATKAGLVMFTHSLRAELMECPVSASVICPGFVSEAGMYARVEATGRRAPGILKATTTEKVTSAVIKAIKRDIAELIVNPFPMRPGIILREVIPGITPYLHKMLGTTDFAREISIERANE